MFEEKGKPNKDFEKRFNERLEKLNESKRSKVVSKSLEVFDKVYRGSATTQKVAAK